MAEASASKKTTMDDSEEESEGSIKQEMDSDSEDSNSSEEKMDVQETVLFVKDIKDEPFSSSDEEEDKMDAEAAIASGIKSELHTEVDFDDDKSNLQIKVDPEEFIDPLENVPSSSTLLPYNIPAENTCLGVLEDDAAPTNNVISSSTSRKMASSLCTGTAGNSRSEVKGTVLEKKRKMDDVYDCMEDCIKTESLENDDTKKENDMQMEILSLQSKKQKISHELEMCRLKVKQEKQKLETLRREQRLMTLQREQRSMTLQRGRLSGNRRRRIALIMLLVCATALLTE